MASTSAVSAGFLTVHRRTKLFQSRNLPDSLLRSTINPSPPPPLSICSLLVLLLTRPPVFPLLRPLSCPYRRSFSLTIATTAPRSAMDPPPSDTTKTVRVVVKGLVQGVFYRNWTVENATQLGLKGWVRNRRDGSVEALFSGSSESVQEMERRCRRGPTNAVVTGFQVFPCSEDPGSSFERRLTG